jgi:membrane-bound lytic murein transglycosylase MltF
MCNQLRVTFVALCLATACGGGQDRPDRSAQAPASGSSAAAPPAATGAGSAHEAPTDETIAAMLAPWRGDLDGMVERRYIRMLVTFSKTNYFLDGVTQRGASYEAGKLFEAFVNERLRAKNIQTHVVFIPVSRDRIFAALTEGRGDIAAASLTITPDRQKQVDFAVPWGEVSEVVVTGQGQPPVTRVEDLSGRAVHVRRSSSYFEGLTTLNKSLHAAGKPPVNIVEAPDAFESEDILEMVHAGVMPATVVDSHLADFWGGIFDQIRVYPKVTLAVNRPIAWALRKNTPRLRELVDTFTGSHGKGTAAFNMVYRRYFEDNKWVRNAASDAELKKFSQARVFFERYGEQYDVPWLLVAAQAYQESQIDQSVRSPVGAVGIMQIKPSTAEGSPINITGVETSAEKNVHAGVKYLRFMADRYYKDEPMDQLNKGLFAVASYNAGPARISQLRRRAEKMGLDPNAWFGNVEVVAAREIGRETVQYVSNIYKYYVTYNLVMEQEEQHRRARGR